VLGLVAEGAGALLFSLAVGPHWLVLVTAGAGMAVAWSRSVSVPSRGRDLVGQPRQGTIGDHHPRRGGAAGAAGAGQGL
jgi:hypothetical protein